MTIDMGKRSTSSFSLKKFFEIIDNLHTVTEQGEEYVSYLLHFFFLKKPKREVQYTNYYLSLTFGLSIHNQENKLIILHAHTPTNIIPPYTPLYLKTLPTGLRVTIKKDT
jgi:hypothetical protein